MPTGIGGTPHTPGATVPWIVTLPKIASGEIHDVGAIRLMNSAAPAWIEFLKCYRLFIGSMYTTQKSIPIFQEVRIFLVCPMALFREAVSIQLEQEQTERTKGSATVSTLRSTASVEASVASAATEDGPVA